MTDRRRALPPVNTLVDGAESGGLMARHPRPVVLQAIRDTLSAARSQGGVEPAGGWLAAIERTAGAAYRSTLTRVINATGVVLHTNLGRAPLADAARVALTEAAGYAALEYELDEGRRGSRQDHTRGLLREVTGAEDAYVTTNAASALLLTLAALAGGGETIVSRSELVEIGGGFRIPEILARSGSRLVEVGTTNRVHLADYSGVLRPETRCVLKVHRSNFRITGFTSEASIEDLARLCKGRVPLVHDVGSGLLLDLERFGLTGEPMVQPSVKAGAVVVFSGDKLLGGPQAGIIVGPSDVLKRIAADPLARALRPDKTTLAALEITLAMYRDPAVALSQIPALRMITAPADELKQRARRLARKLPGATLVPGESEVGGGAFPGAPLPTMLIAIDTPSCEAMLDTLRSGTPPIVARAAGGRVVLDVRTIADEEFPAVVQAVEGARRV